MPATALMNHVFVDFENIPGVDLAAIGDQSVAVTLLIGVKQQRLDLGLVRQIHAHAAKVTLIEVGASGRNALDMVLAWHLGKVAERHPADAFFVVSKDKDFDPLIRHLHALGLNVARVDAFSALPFLPAAAPARRAPAPRRAAAVTPQPVAIESGPSSADAAGPAPDARLAKLTQRLEERPNARPVRRKTLLSHINGYYNNQLTEPELEAIVETLVQQGTLSIDANGRVSYR